MTTPKSQIPEGLEVRFEAPPVTAYRALIETTGWDELDGHPTRDIQAALDRSWFAVSVLAEDEVVACGRVVSDGVLYALLLDIVVEPSHQGRGIGGHVVQLLLERCRSARISDVLLFAARGTMPFYELHGFVRRSGDSPGMIYRYDSN